MRRHELAAVLALAGLLFRLLIVAVHVPPSAAAQTAAGAPSAASLFSQIVLCTATGLRVVQLDENGNPVDPGQSPGSAQSCPICTSLAGASLAPAPTLIALPVPAYARYAIAFEREPLVAGHKPLVARGRDPPFQA
jgi:Protein of unknown function (DUF2946)